MPGPKKSQEANAGGAPTATAKLPKDVQRRLASLEANRARPKEYLERYGEAPVQFSAKQAKKVLNRCLANLNYVRIVTGIDGRLSEIVRSDEFRARLAGIDPEQLQSANPNDLLNQDALVSADTMVEKLRWALTALSGTHAGIYEDRQESTRQLAQLGVLLKQRMPNGLTVYSALKEAAADLYKDRPAKYVPKSKRPKENEINADLNENPMRKPKPKLEDSMQGDLMADLYQLDELLELGLDMPRLDPQSVRPEPDLRKAKSWAECSQMLDAPLPCAPKARQERLAKMLVVSFKTRRRQLALNRGEILPRDDFSKSRLDSYLAQLKQLPVFQQLIKDPAKVSALLEPGEQRQAKQFKAMLNVFRPFASLDEAQSRQVLSKLQGMLQYLDPPEGRSKEWKALIAGIQSIDLKDPGLNPEQKLQEIYEKSCAYMKGKKSLRDDEARQNRFDQALDVLAVLGEIGEYARMAAQSVVDRINEVRIGHDESYRPISLKQFGAGAILDHSNVPKKAFNALDPLPPAKALPTFPAEWKSSFKPLHDYTRYITPLQFEDETTIPDIKVAIATVIALSRRQAYYYPNKAQLRDSDLVERLRVQGSTVIRDIMPNGNRKAEDLDAELLRLDADPAVDALARKYVKPEARRELLMELPREEQKRVKWADQKQEPPAKQLKLPQQKTVYRFKPGSEPTQKDRMHPDGQQQRHSWKAAYGGNDYDPRRLNVAKLLEEYRQAKLELEAGHQLAL